MKTLRHFAFAMLAVFPTIVLAAPSDGDAPKTVVITATDSLRFNVTRIDAKPREKIRLVLRNEGSLPKDVMGHNWVLLKAGQDPSAYAAGAVAAKSENFQPASLAAE